jgi:hypothetical protein
MTLLWNRMHKLLLLLLENWSQAHVRSRTLSLPRCLFLLQHRHHFLPRSFLRLAASYCICFTPFWRGS